MTAAGDALAGPPQATARAPALARHQRGVALVIVLWTLALLSVLAGVFSTASRTHVRLAFNIVERTKAEALADAAVSRAIAGLLIAPEEGGLRVDGTPYAWAFDGSEVVFAIADEGGKIDLNVANAELLAAAFAALGVPARTAARIADAIVDFRDEDDIVSANGAEAADYRRNGMLHRPKDAPFERVDELGLVFGMTADLVALISPVATVYTGIPEPITELMPQEYRLLLEGVFGETTADADDDADPNADSSTAPAARLGQRRGLPRPAAAGTTAVLASLRAEGSDTRSEVNIYTIHAEARSAGGGVYVRDAVVLIEADAVPAFRFLDLRQGSRRFLVNR